MAVLTRILEWSAGQPEWQRDALRRIITQEGVNEEDVAELCKICLDKRGIINLEGPAPTPVPLGAEHLPQTGGNTDRVQMVGLRNIQGIDALAPNQVMNFQQDGMTVIFGCNGSGKSSYARILRALCHARQSGDLVGNIYSKEKQEKQSAEVGYNIGGSDRWETWCQGQSPPVDLGRINFFDADCAPVHVDKANELAFTPFGLDVLPKLVNICQKISKSIDTLVQDEESKRPSSLIDPVEIKGTKVGMKLLALSAGSNAMDFESIASTNFATPA